MLDSVCFHNSLRQYLSSAALFALILWAFLLGRRHLVARLRWLAERTSTKIDDVLVDLVAMIKNPECYLVAFYFATRPLVLPPWLDRGFRAAVVLTVTYRVVMMLQRLAQYAIGLAFAQAGEDDASYRHTVRAISYLVNAVLWVGALTFVLGNLGFNISSMLAGLGIGGIAVALAAQTVLSDVFAAIAIYLDRPFVTGDFIVCGDVVGTIDSIGFKTTRVRALSGELLVVPNSTIATSKVRNFRHLHERRVVVAFGVAYGTPAEALGRLPSEVRGLLDKAGGEKVRVDRIHLKGFGESSIDFEVVYFVLSPDYNVYMDVNHNFHLALVEHLAKSGISIPFPTRTVFLEKAA